MAKKQRMTPATKVTCSKCGKEAHGIPGTKHRRCGGSAGANLKDHHEKPLSTDRGIWN
jgi:hypothetical protein